LRGFRALYLGWPINCVIIGWVNLARWRKISAPPRVHDGLDRLTASRSASLAITAVLTPAAVPASGGVVVSRLLFQGSAVRDGQADRPAHGWIRSHCRRPGAVARGGHQTGCCAETLPAASTFESPFAQRTVGRRQPSPALDPLARLAARRSF
jgi:hypothetical protein